MKIYQSIKNHILNSKKYYLKTYHPIMIESWKTGLSNTEGEKLFGFWLNILLMFDRTSIEYMRDSKAILLIILLLIGSNCQKKLGIIHQIIQKTIKFKKLMINTDAMLDNNSKLFNSYVS